MTLHRFSTLALGMALLATGATAWAQNTEATPPVGATASAPAAPATLGAKELPKVSVRWACGDCEQNDKVAPLITSDYEAQASATGYTVSSAETAEIIITEYRQRPPAMRVLFGIMAGKDKLATKVLFRGKEYKADDYSANAFSGMNSLCASVAKTAADQLTAALKN